MYKHDIFPVSQSNQITKAYYNCLIGQVNNKTSSQEVQKVLRTNGNYNYFTYHLVSIL